MRRLFDSLARRAFRPARSLKSESRSRRAQLGIERLEDRDLMAAGLDATALFGSYLSVDNVAYDQHVPVQAQFQPGTHVLRTYFNTASFTVAADSTVNYDAALDGFFSGRGTDTLRVNGSAVQIDARALNGNYLALDYTPLDADRVLDARLLPGRHFLMALGGTTSWFSVSQDGTVAYDAALEGTLSGQGTHALQVRGAPIQLDARALNGSYVALDYVAYDGDEVLHTALLPGDHSLMIQGGAMASFKVAANGTIDYDAALDGIFNGRGTSSLTVNGAPVEIDAGWLNGSYVALDYVPFDGEQVRYTALLPGDHLLMMQGGATATFQVTASGTLDYDPALEGILSGRGTHSLRVFGAQVSIDASALPGSYAALDYVPFDGDQLLYTGLLPGAHTLTMLGGATVQFQVTADGTINYAADLEGVLQGRGTDFLTIQGVHLTIDPQALAATSYLSLDSTPFALNGLVDVRILPGTHSLHHDSTISWFTVNADGTVTGDPAAVNAIHPVTPISEALASIPEAAQVLGNALGGEQTFAGGRYQLFEHGGIYWSEATGAHVLTGDFFQEYQADGGPTGVLGLPTMDLETRDDVRYVNFQNGAIVAASLALRTFVGETYTPGVPDENIDFSSSISQTDLATRQPGSIDSWLGLLLSLPQLSSKPDAPATLYLNFLGDFIPGWWGYTFNFAKSDPLDVSIDAFSMDNEYRDFSLAEQAFIRKVWQAVAEDYAPFNINVTTVYPGAAPSSHTLRVDIGGRDFVGDRRSGTSGFFSFTNDAPNVAFAFAKTIQEYGNHPPDFSDDLANQIATTASHEAGHTFGLDHDRLYGPNWDFQREYDPGNGITTPIMGDNLSTVRTTWSDRYVGTVVFADTPTDGVYLLLSTDGTNAIKGGVRQYDLDVIGSARNGFGLRADDHASTLESATRLDRNFTTGLLTGEGIIGLNNDVDAFSFQTEAGAISIRLNTIGRFANLDSRIELWSARGIIAVADPEGNLDASITTTVEAGQYYVLVRSHGGYGDIGQYTLTVADLATPEPNRYDLIVRPGNVADLIPPDPNRIDVFVGPGNFVTQLLEAPGATQHLQGDPSAPDELPLTTNLPDVYVAPALDVQAATSIAELTPVEPSPFDLAFRSGLEYI